MLQFIRNPSSLQDNVPNYLKRFAKLVDLNKNNPGKDAKRVLKDFKQLDITFEDRFPVLSDYAFAKAKETGIFEPLFGEKKTGGRKKTHKLRLKLKIKIKNHSVKRRGTQLIVCNSCAKSLNA
jgi:hypothetical protein